MPDLKDAVLLYVETAKKWKDKAEKNTVQRAAVIDDQLYVDGIPVDYDSIYPNRFVNGDVVYVAQTEDDNKVVVLG
jgi:hypothetical protein